MIRPRNTLRRGEPTEAEKQECRVKARTRVKGMCEYHLLDGTEILGVRIEASLHCLIGPLPLEGDCSRVATCATSRASACTDGERAMCNGICGDASSVTDGNITAVSLARQNSNSPIAEGVLLPDLSAIHE